MITRAAAALVAIGAIGVLSGCSSAAPEPTPSSTVAVDTSEQSEIIGEWVVTRTVVSSDDAANPAHAAGAVSSRALLFSDVTCTRGPCTGTVSSGPTAAIRDTTEFSSAGDVIRYEFTGTLHCLRQDTGSVLVANGYQYTATVELRVVATDTADESRATTLEGELTYTDVLTPEAIEGGCTRTPETATTEYSLSAVRAIVANTVPTAPPAT